PRPEHTQPGHGPPAPSQGRSRRTVAAGWTRDRRPPRDRPPVNVPTDLLSSIGISVGFAALIAAVTWRFKQPLIIAYLLTGVIIGPNIGLGFVSDQASIATVAEIGLILLLFVIGLEIDVRKMASGGTAVLLTGALQVPLCIALGLL